MLSDIMLQLSSFKELLERGSLEKVCLSKLLKKYNSQKRRIGTMPNNGNSNSNEGRLILVDMYVAQRGYG